VKKQLNEEARTLLRRIVESQAHREIMSINMLGHCLKYVTDLETKLRVAEDLDLSLRLFRDVQRLYAELGWQDLDSAVRDRMTELPFPDSRLEFGVAYHVGHVAREVAMESYRDCRVVEFAAIARSYVAAAASRPVPTRFLEFCEDPTNRPRAQELFQRWFGIVLAAFGRPDTKNDERAVELGLRSRTAAESRQEYVERLKPFVAQCGLAFPATDALGEELAAGLVLG
jgi:1,2-phenylacetyl-CoA epoxidase catalytic subunit